MNGCKTPPGKQEMETQPIDICSRAQAIAHGVLVDVSASAEDVGWRVPVALTPSAFECYVRAPAKRYAEDEEDRLKDVLAMVGQASATLSLTASAACLTLCARNLRRPEDAFELKAMCEPGDDGQPAVTIMTPEETGSMVQAN